MATRRRPATEDKLEALHYQLIEAVADLASSEGWMRMLGAAARFYAYSGGGAAVFELRECPGDRSSDPSPLRLSAMASLSLFDKVVVPWSAQVRSI